MLPSMMRFLESLVIAFWNRLQGRRTKPSKESASALTLGLRVMEGQVTNQRIAVSLTRRTTHAAAFGITGSGKSFWVKHCAAQDAAANRGGLFIDFHGDLTPFLLGTIANKEWTDERQLSGRVIVIAPADPEMSVGLNPLEGLATDFVRATEFAEILRQRYNLDALGARTEELLRNAIVVLAANGLTLLEIAPLLSDDRFRAQCLEKTPNAEVREYFAYRYGRASEPMKATMREPILNKITGFVADPRFRHIVGQAQSTFSMKDAMDRNCWVIAYLPKGELGGQAVTFAALLFTMFKNAVFTRERRSFFPAYFDEFQNLIAQATDVETVLSEARKFGVGIVAVNQFLGQYPASMREAMLSIGTHLCFQLSSTDATLVSQMFDGGKPLAETLKNLAPRHFIVKSGSDRWVEGWVPTVEEPRAKYADLLNRSRALYAKPRAEIERAIAARREFQSSKPDEALHDWD